MALTIQIKKGIEANRTAFIPKQGEFIFTTDTHRVFIGDGGTPGGVAVGGDFKLLEYLKPPSTSDIEQTDTVQSALGKLERALDTATAGGGDANVQSDWDETSTTSDAYIKNKPAIVDDVTTGGSTSLLSAEQGKTLNESIQQVVATAGSNTTAISGNATHIAANTTAINKNTHDIAANTGAIAANTTDIVALKKVGRYRGTYETVADRDQAIPSPVKGDYVLIGTAAPYTEWIFDTTWEQAGFASSPTGVVVIDDVTTGGSTSALSAEQGKVLKALVDDNTQARVQYATEHEVDLGTESTKAISPVTLKHATDKVVAISDIVDNLTSTDTDKTLSANQGKILKDLIETGGAVKKMDDLTDADMTTMPPKASDLMEFDGTNWVPIDLIDLGTF